MAWVWLIAAGLCDAAWIVLLKGQWLGRMPSLLICMAMSAITAFLVNFVLKDLPLSTGYAAWLGIVVTLVLLASVVIFREQFSPGRMVCLGLIFAGVLGLKLIEGGTIKL